jgi:hypothetical protein
MSECVDSRLQFSWRSDKLDNKLKYVPWKMTKKLRNLLPNEQWSKLKRQVKVPTLTSSPHPRPLEYSISISCSTYLLLITMHTVLHTILLNVRQAETMMILHKGINKKLIQSFYSIYYGMFELFFIFRTITFMNTFCIETRPMTTLNYEVTYLKINLL